MAKRQNYTNFDSYYNNKRKEIKPAVIEEEKKEAPLYRIRVVYPRLRVRKTPNGEILREVTTGDEFDIMKEENGWGQLAEGNWLMLKFTEKI